NTQITSSAALFGVGDGGAFHWAFHRTRPAARANIQSAQAEFIAHFLGVLILRFANTVAAPANNQIGFAVVFEDTSVSYNMEHTVGNTRRAAKINVAVFLEFIVDINQVPQHRK